MKPKVTATRSLPDNFNAYFKVLLPLVFLIANEISLPANSPTKHQVVDIGILEIILKTNRTIAYKIFTSEASGLSLILDFSFTTCQIFSPPQKSIIPSPRKIIKQTATNSTALIFLGKKMAKLLMSCYNQTDQRIPLDTHNTTCQYFGSFPLVLSQYSDTNLENGR